MDTRAVQRVQIADLVKQISVRERLEPDQPYRLLGVRLAGNGVFLREQKLGSEIGASSLSPVRAGDFIYSRLFAWRGAFGLISPEFAGCYVSGEFPTFEIDTSAVEPRYLELYFSQPAIWSEVETYCTGSTPASRNRFNERYFLGLELTIPPIREQQRIVARIETFSMAIEAAKRVRKKVLTELALTRSAILSKHFGAESAVGKLGDILTRRPRNGWSARCDNLEGGTPVLSLSAVTGFRYQSSAFKRTSEATAESAHYWLREGDLLITRSNTPELVGHAAIYDGNPSPCIYPDLLMRLELDGTRATTSFVHLWLQSPQVRNFIRANAKGTSPTMKKISQDIVTRIPFPTGLSIDRQHGLVAEFDAMQEQFDAIGRLQSEATLEVDALLPAILNRAFHGYS